jgi:sulfoxide reductase heme-binding subunit YedZ
VFLPFASDYRPLWLSLGALALDLLLAVLITSLLRDRINHRAWQAVHLLVYLCWPVALWHGLGTGTDTKLPWVLTIYACCLAAVIAAVTWRLALTPDRTVRAAAAAAIAFATVLTVIFVVAGPLRPGWAARAGTPPALLGLFLVESVAGRS